MQSFKSFALNIIGLIAGFAANTAAYYLFSFILIDLLGKVPFIANFFSWPADYSWYAAVGTVISSAIIGIFVCAKICKLSKSKFSYGSIFFGIINSIYYIYAMFSYFSNEGFSFTALFLYLLTVATYIIGTIEFATNKD